MSAHKGFKIFSRKLRQRRKNVVFPRFRCYQAGRAPLYIIYGKTCAGACAHCMDGVSSMHGRGLVDAWTEPRRRMDGASSTHGWSLVDAWTEPRRRMDGASLMHGRKTQHLHQEFSINHRRDRSRHRDALSPSSSLHEELD